MVLKGKCGNGPAGAFPQRDSDSFTYNACGHPRVKTWREKGGSSPECALGKLGQLLGPLLINWRHLIFPLLSIRPDFLTIVCVFCRLLRILSRRRQVKVNS